LPLPGSTFLSRQFRHPIAGERSVADAEPIKNFQRFWNISPRSMLTEICFGPQGREFFGNGDVNELIERGILRLGDTTQFLQKRRLRTKRKIALSMGSNLQNRERLRWSYSTNPEFAGAMPQMCEVEGDDFEWRHSHPIGRLG
jgi:hypothetical protein